MIFGHASAMASSLILRSIFLILALFSVGSVVANAETGDSADDIAEWSMAFDRFVTTLDEDQRTTALYAFGDEERFDLRLAPLGIEGLRIDEMTDEQWAELESLLGAVLSPAGLAKMNTIRSLENEVAEIEGGLFGFLMDRIRNAKRYFLAIFGEPLPDGVWGLRFDGHHFSFNWTAVPGKALSVTPIFWGGQPRVVPEGLERAGLRVLADEENRAIAFINGLTPAERETSRLPFSYGSGIRRPMFVSGDVPLSLEKPEGLAYRELSPDDRIRLDDIIEVQLGNFASPVASHYRARIAEDADSIRFAHAVPDHAEATALSSGQSLYYRIQGEAFLIEYDNTSKEADHVHVVWRDLEGDFGGDILGEHLAAQHPTEAPR
jgi:hypothetical protein